MKQQPQTYVIPGRNIRIGVSMLNELDMFRNDDIIAECPIPLRAVAIPIEDDDEVDSDGQPKVRREIICEVLTRRIKVKPQIERGGAGSVVVQLSPSPVLRPDETLRFILKIGLSTSSRIFDHVIPVCTPPLIMVSPESKYAREQLKRRVDSEQPSDNEDEDDDIPYIEDGEEFDGEVIEVYLEEDHDHHHNHQHDHHHHHHHHHHHQHTEHDEDIDDDEEEDDNDEDDESDDNFEDISDYDIYEDPNGDFDCGADCALPDDVQFQHTTSHVSGEEQAVLPCDEDGNENENDDDEDEDADEDYEYDEDDEDAEHHEHEHGHDHEHDHEHDHDGLGDPCGCDGCIIDALNGKDTRGPCNHPKPGDDDNDNDDPEEPDLSTMKGAYHAFVADPLFTSPIHPDLQSYIQSQTTNQQQSTNAVNGATNNTSSQPSSSSSSSSQQSIGSSSSPSPSAPSPLPPTAVGVGIRRRPKVIPPAVLKAQQAAQQRMAGGASGVSSSSPSPGANTNANTSGSSSTDVSSSSSSSASSAAALLAESPLSPDTSITTTPLPSSKHPVIGLKSTGNASILFNVPRSKQILHPLNGIFSTNLHNTSSTLHTRQVAREAAFAYIKVVNGLSVGGRIWDGAIYMLKFFHLLFSLVTTPLDGLRGLELGSGTGVIGIWLWKMIEQRNAAQLKAFAEHLHIKPSALSAVLDIMCGGNFIPANIEFLGITPTNLKEVNSNNNNNKKNDNNDDNHNTTPTITEDSPEFIPTITSITVDKKVYNAAMMIMKFAPPPCMIVTDHGYIMSLLDQNTNSNGSKKPPHWRTRLHPSAITVEEITQQSHPKQVRLSLRDDETTPQRLRIESTTISGLHSLSLDWAQPLTKHIYKSCGVVIAPENRHEFDGTSSYFASLSTTPSLTSEQPQQQQPQQQQPQPQDELTKIAEYTPGHTSITQLSHDMYDDLRLSIILQYDSYQSLREGVQRIQADETAIPIPEQIHKLFISTNYDHNQANSSHTTTPASTSTTPSPAFFIHTPKPVNVLLASECLYNDRYFDSLRLTIERLFTAQKYSFAQLHHHYTLAVQKFHTYMKATTSSPESTSSSNKYSIPPPPSLHLPIIFLSYRFRATHEAELIQQTFFEPLEQVGLYHTEVSLNRILERQQSTVVQDLMSTKANKAVSEIVRERMLDRKKKEDELRNAIVELDCTRQEQTRFAIIFYSPGKDCDGNVISPLPYLAPPAAFLYRLFQKL